MLDLVLLALPDNTADYGVSLVAKPLQSMARLPGLRCIGVDVAGNAQSGRPGHAAWHRAVPLGIIGNHVHRSVYGLHLHMLHCRGRCAAGACNISGT